MFSKFSKLCSKILTNFQNLSKIFSKKSQLIFMQFQNFSKYSSFSKKCNFWVIFNNFFKILSKFHFFVDNPITFSIRIRFISELHQCNGRLISYSYISLLLKTVSYSMFYNRKRVFLVSTDTYIIIKGA